jgi:ABC-type polysaccharide/polyol phosphate transport system ATPase subunit
MSEQPLIEVRHLSKSFQFPTVRWETVREHALGLFRPRTFRTLNVLEDVGFDVRRGETVGIMGRNGSGKSTLLKIISGVYRADRGHVVVRAPITPILELGLGWNPDLDAVDNILVMATVMGLSLREAEGSTEEILAFAGLERFANMEVRHFSSGMAARLAFAVAFKAVREVLILDEIFAVGDAGFQKRCEDRYRQLSKAGYTVILVSHDPATVSKFCTRALLLEGGRIVANDTARHVVAAYQRVASHTSQDGAFG